MRRLAEETDGAIAVMVAIMMIMLIGFGAIAVDAGALFAERRQLQNGADAAVLALAAECAEGLIDCASASVPVLSAAAQPYADANAHDLRAAVPATVTHGTDPAACAPGADAAPNPLAGSNAVKVSTETIDAANSDAGFLTHFFAPILGIDTTTVGACATAVWGYAKSLGTFPLVLSACEYDDTTVTWPRPHPNPLAVQEKVLFHSSHAAGSADPCNAEAGHDTDGDEKLPGGFGWLVNDGDCEVVTTTVDGEEWVDRDPGSNPECDDTELAALLDTVVHIPVFDDVCRHTDAACPTYSNNDKYRIAKYAAFYLQGYKLGGGPADEGGDHSSCTGPERCIVGYFTTSVSLDGEIGGPPGGVLVVQLTG